MAACACAPAFVALLTCAAALSLRDDPCHCLSWKAQLAAHSEQCAAFGEQDCVGFFSNLEEPFCVNSAFGEAPIQHCLVQSACTDLRGGSPLTGDLSLKECIPGEDAMLKHKEPLHLAKLASRYHLDMSLLAKLAYPTVPSVTWSSAKKFWTTRGTAQFNTTDLERHGLTAEQQAALQQVVDIGMPALVDSEDGQPPFGMVFRWKAFEVTLDAKHAGEPIGKSKRSYDRPDELSKVTCITGCDG